MSNLFYFVCRAHSGVHRELCFLCSGTRQFHSFAVLHKFKLRNRFDILPNLQTSREKSVTYLHFSTPRSTVSWEESFRFCLWNLLRWNLLRSSLCTALQWRNLINFSPENRFGKMKKFVEKLWNGNAKVRCKRGMERTI